MATTPADVTSQPNLLTPTPRNVDEGQGPRHAQIVTSHPANPLVDSLVLTSVDAAPSDLTIAQEAHAPPLLPTLTMLPKLTNLAPTTLVTNALLSLTDAPSQAQNKATQAPPLNSHTPRLVLLHLDTLPPTLVVPTLPLLSL